MNIDPTTALIVTQMLSPYLSKYGEAIASKLGERTIEGIAGLWKAIRDKFKGKREAQNALEEFSKSPNDEQAQERFRRELEIAFSEDPAFARQLVPFIVASTINITNTGTQINYFNSPLLPETPEVSKRQRQIRKATGLPADAKQLIYQQDDFANTFQETGKSWDFWSDQIENSTAFWIRNGVIAVGGDGPDSKAIVQTPAPPARDVYIEFDVQLQNVFGKADNWAGVRLRGLTPYQGIGYLVYLRATGSLELYRGTKKWDGGKLAVNTPMHNWVRIKAECRKDKIKVWVGGRRIPHIEQTDKWFGGEGNVYLHTWGAKALFKGIKVHSYD